MSNNFSNKGYKETEKLQIEMNIPNLLAGERD